MHFALNESRSRGLGFLYFSVMVGFSLGLLAHPVCAASSEDPVKFRWAFVALTGSGDKAVLEPIREDRVLRTGDQFKMMVEVDRDCYVYVIYHNAQDGMKLLFPYTLGQFDSDYVKLRKYYIPMGNAWFELDQHVGRETFYLLGSADRLALLEDHFTAYETADAVKRSDLIRLITEEIHALRRKHRELTAPAERPVPIGGAVRGLETRSSEADLDIARFAEEIVSRSGVIVRTYNIDHR